MKKREGNSLFLRYNKPYSENIKTFSYKSVQNINKLLTLSSFLKLTPHCILISSADGSWQAISRSFEKLLSITEKEWQSKSREELLKHIENSPYLPLLQREESSPLPPEGICEEISISLKDSSEVHFETFRFPLFSENDGALAGELLIANDITKQVSTIQELAESKKEADEALKQKDRFVSMIAHDFRSPISSILSLLKLLQRDTEHPLSEKQHREVNELLSIAEQTYNMFQELLSLSRLKSGHLQPKPKFFDAQLIVDLLGRSIAPLAKRKGVRIINKIAAGTRVYADPNLFGEVVQNLLTNAVKFTKEGDIITIDIRCDEEKNETLLYVNDTGIGINESFSDNLFSHDVKTTTRGTNGERGTGLGLPFCADILSAHNGRMSTHVTEKKETCFCAHFPTVKPVILLVEDERIARSMLKRHLVRLNVEIMEAENGKEALEKIAEKRPHLVLSDLMMPVMNGFDFVQEMKKDPLLRSIPIIITTADNDMKTREKLLWLGADDYTTKPIIIEDLIPRVRRYII